MFDSLSSFAHLHPTLFSGICIVVLGFTASAFSLFDQR